ncbi:hypothetical protein K435DRAFT_874779 [Dendrothele bispora CBS 962.96]|uniref:Uncharacterized protein n=1 Tax=Dendrothele bispora (strain CBS 962.96) TaxID=1314807 RepID=A0A4S8KW23_DENBC|nr:hypothetical protein K435DRAFT_874779 [Dendrothele bispora CBS 962.96]
MATINSTLPNFRVNSVRIERSSTREGLDLSPHACGAGHHSPDLCYPVDSSPRVDSPANEFDQIVQQERSLLDDFNRLKQDYDDWLVEALNQVVLAVQKELEVISNLAVKNFRGNITRVESETLNQARILGSAMSAAHYLVLHDDLPAFNSSRAVTGFSNETDDIITRILKYATEEVPGIETFLKSTPSPIPVAIKSFSAPSAAPMNPVILAGVQVGPSTPLGTAPPSSGPDRVFHPLPMRPEVSTNNDVANRRRRRRNAFKRNSNNIYKGNA